MSWLLCPWQRACLPWRSHTPWCLLWVLQCSRVCYLILCAYIPSFDWIPKACFRIREEKMPKRFEARTQSFFMSLLMLNARIVLKISEQKLLDSCLTWSGRSWRDWWTSRSFLKMTINGTFSNEPFFMNGLRKREKIYAGMGGWVTFITHELPASSFLMTNNNNVTSKTRKVSGNVTDCQYI